MDLRALKEYWHIEIAEGPTKRFSWWRLHRICRRETKYRYLFWFRLAQYLHQSERKMVRRYALTLHDSLRQKYGMDIALDATIGLGFHIVHPVGIVITRKAVIGENFTIFQNSTIGQKDDNSEAIVIGDNVSVGAHCCIIGNNLKIGDNVEIGAAAFVNVDIPADHIYYSRNTCVLIPKKTAKK